MSFANRSRRLVKAATCAADSFIGWNQMWGQGTARWLSSTTHREWQWRANCSRWRDSMGQRRSTALCNCGGLAIRKIPVWRLNFGHPKSSIRRCTDSGKFRRTVASVARAILISIKKKVFWHPFQKTKSKISWLNPMRGWWWDKLLHLCVMVYILNELQEDGKYLRKNIINRCKPLTNSIRKWSGDDMELWIYRIVPLLFW
jgi:hypothetical protein